MMALLQDPMNWVKAGLSALALAFVVWFYFYFTGLQRDAALLPQVQAQNTSLQKQIAQSDASAAKAAIDLAKLMGQYNQAATDLSNWQDFRGQIDTALQARIKNAPVTVNPVCAPNALDRQLWNDALGKLSPNSGP